MATIKDLKRMCRSFDNCNNCPLGDNCKSHFPIENLPDCADEIIDKWVKEHPIKTYLRDLKSKFPNLDNLDDVYSNVCRKLLYNGKFSGCEHEHSCIACWNQEMKENNA